MVHIYMNDKGFCPLSMLPDATIKMRLHSVPFSGGERLITKLMARPQNSRSFHKSRRSDLILDLLISLHQDLNQTLMQ